MFALALCLGVNGKWTSHAAVTPSDDAAANAMTPMPVNLFFAGDEHGFDVSNMDKSVGACENFYQYANGGWNARNPIPAAYPSWGRFNELAERNRDQLHQILEDAAHNKKARKGSNEQKIGDYYASCMDEEKIEAAGTRPIQAELTRINKIKDQKSLRETIAHLQSMGVPVLFRFGSGQDYKQSTQVIGQLSQGGLSLPDRDYYINTDEKSKDIRDKYVAHVTRMFQLLGDDANTSAAEAGTVMSIETKLAEASATRVQRRNPEANYHKLSQGELTSLTKNFSWGDYFKTVGLPGSFDVNVGQPDFFKALDQQLTAVPIADWKTYLRWHLLDAKAAALPKKFVQEDFDFNQGVLSGTKEMLPRWKRCVRATDIALGEAVGQVYVQKTFPPEAKARAVTMVQNLIAALRDDLGTLSWMSETTRQRATAKLEAFTRKIGYPEQWRDYSTLKVERKSYMDDSNRAALFEFNRQLAKIGKPVNRTEWGMTPPTVNAYYSPTMNEIVFPAGILQWPFYDPKADDALNYGGIGAVIGHEMTHGFDDSGAKFDPQGNLQNWWTEADLKNFQGRAQCVVDQFDSFLVQPGLHHNGKLVVGESIADLGGLTVAFAALQKSMEGKPRPAPIDGFTPEQRFFLGYAQIWAQNVRPEYERQLVLTDPHPLGRFRVNGPLSNMPAFAQAFQCKAGEPMVRPDKERCQIW
jgi:putative endopeptidase